MRTLARIMRPFGRSPERNPEMKFVLPLLLFVAAWSVPSLAEEVLPFEILSVEQQKKGASVRPAHPPRYVLLIARVALKGAHPALTEENVAQTLRDVLQAVRVDATEKGVRCDGVSVYLYESPDHWNSRSMPLGEAEWWPKGHSFSFENDANVRNEATHIEAVKVLDLPKAPSSVVSRLSLEKRKEVFAAAVHGERRAEQEAEAKYPTLGNHIPIEKLRTYDVRAAMEKKTRENERLRAKYEAAILKKYKISESELQLITMEALMQNWPVPRR